MRFEFCQQVEGEFEFLKNVDKIDGSRLTGLSSIVDFFRKMLEADLRGESFNVINAIVEQNGVFLHWILRYAELETWPFES